LSKEIIMTKVRKATRHDVSGGPNVKLLAPPAKRKSHEPMAPTIEQRLLTKAAEADEKPVSGPSLGSVSRAERRKLLFG